MLVARAPALLSPLILPSAHALADNTSFSWSSFAPTQGLLLLFYTYRLFGGPRSVGDPPWGAEDPSLCFHRQPCPPRCSPCTYPCAVWLSHPHPTPRRGFYEAKPSSRSGAGLILPVSPALAWALLPAAAPGDQLSTPPRRDVPDTPPVPSPPAPSDFPGSSATPPVPTQTRPSGQLPLRGAVVMPGTRKQGCPRAEGQGWVGRGMQPAGASSVHGQLWQVFLPCGPSQRCLSSNRWSA